MTKLSRFSPKGDTLNMVGYCSHIQQSTPRIKFHMTYHLMDLSGFLCQPQGFLATKAHRFLFLCMRLQSYGKDSKSKATKPGPMISLHHLHTRLAEPLTLILVKA